MQIVGHTFIVTGGSSGLGAGTAQRLVEAGGNVVLADVNVAGGEAMATELGGQAAFVRTDVTNEGDVQTAVSTTIERFGGLHGVVNCAGIAIAARTLSRSGPHDLAAFSRVIQINLIGTFNMIRLAANHMINNEPMGEIGERGVIINTASVAAYDGQIGQAAYSASKGGIVGMTLPIAREFASFGIRVATIAPGIFDTPMMAGLPEQARISLAASVPFPKRLGTPADYAFLAQHIIENEMINGETIRLDGAIRLAPK
ncbi:MAG: 3-hydroxyacyl-CoA dehydrogenase [Anaerolineales bacterium]|nr:3-hydroxyacyl-CoA dehydrogenase [Anaerolineales bacterium]